MQLGDVKKSLSWRLIEEYNEIKKGWLCIISRDFPKENNLPKPTKRLRIAYFKVWKGKLSFKSENKIKLCLIKDLIGKIDLS